MKEVIDCKTNPKFILDPLSHTQQGSFFPGAAGPLLMTPTDRETKRINRVNIITQTHEPETVIIADMPFYTGGSQLEKWTDLKKKPYHFHVAINPKLSPEIKPFLEGMLERTENPGPDYLVKLNILYHAFHLSFSSTDGLYLLYNHEVLFGLGLNNNFPGGSESFEDFAYGENTEDNPRHPSEFVLVHPNLYKGIYKVDTDNQWFGSSKDFTYWRANLSRPKKGKDDLPYGFDFHCMTLNHKGHQEAIIVAHLGLAQNSYMALRNRFAEMVKEPISSQKEKGLFDQQLRDVLRPEINIIY